jgi:MFS family permease
LPAASWWRRPCVLRRARTRAWHAFAAAAAVGLGAAIVRPAQDALLATLVRPDQRSSAFAMHHALLNAGFGVGAVAAAVLVEESSPSTFELVYVLDGLSFVAFLPVLLTLPAGRVGAEHGAGGGFRNVLAERLFLRVWVLPPNVNLVPALAAE